MARRAIAGIVVLALLGTPLGGEPAQTIREQVLLIPTGTEVVVRLETKEKIRGRLGEAGESRFTVRGEAVDYDAVERIDVVRGGKFGRAWMWVLVGAGTAAVVLGVVALASGGG